MDRSARLGHVSKDRLLGEGSAFARQLARARDEQQQQQQLQLAVHQGHDTDQDTELEEEQQEAPQLTWTELWDARTVSGCVGTALRHDERRQLQLQLWWPPEKPKSTSNAPDAHFLRYSSVRARALQRQQQQQQQRAPGEAASAAAYRRVTELLFGHHQCRATSSQPQQHGKAAAAESLACDWVCCNRPLPAVTETSGKPSRGLPPCGAVNPGPSVRCTECGAARWDGPGGQLQALLRAALQTADLDTSTLKQVVRRIAAESSSSAGVGFQLPVAAVKAEVAAFLAERSTSKPPPAAAAQAKSTSATYGRGERCTVGQAGPDSCEVQELPPSCPVAAAGVYTSLVTCLQNMPEQHNSGQLQQQQQLQQRVEASARVHAAAVAAALLAPGLLHGVFQRRLTKLPAVTPVSGAIQAWVGDLFDHAAAAAAASGGPRKLPVQAVSRPLPACTVQQLVDRRGAVLQQGLRDTAHGCPAAAVGGASSTFNCLPVVTRSFEDESTGDVLISEQVSPREWLVHTWASNTSKKCRMPAGAFSMPADGIQQQHSPGDDISVTELIECDEWEAVVAVRQHVQHILATWCGGSWRAQQRQRQRRRRTGYRTLLDRSSEVRLQGRILSQRACALHAWGSAPHFGLRQVLQSTCKPQHAHLQQRQTGRSKEHAGRGTAAAGRRKQQQQIQKEKRVGVGLPVDGPSTAAGARHCKPTAETAAAAGAPAGVAGQQQQQQGDQQEQPVKQGRKRSREQETLKASDAAADVNTQQTSQRLPRTAGHGSSGGTAAAAAAAVVLAKATNSEAADGTSSSSSESSSSSGNDRRSSGDESDNGADQISSPTAGSNSSESDWVDSDAEERMARARRAKRLASGADAVAAPQGDTTGELEHILDSTLASVDDLMLEPAAAPHSGAFRPRPGGAWQAPDEQGQHNRASQNGPTHAVHGERILPAGMQVVLQQAAAMGISANVVQRTVARLEALLSQHEPQCL